MNSRFTSYFGEVFYLVAATIFAMEQYALGNNLVAVAVMHCAFMAAFIRAYSLYENGGIYARSNFASSLARAACFAILTPLLFYVSELAAYPIALAAVAFGVSAYFEWSQRDVQLVWKAHPEWVRDKLARHKQFEYHIYQNVHDDWLTNVKRRGQEVATLKPVNTQREAMGLAQVDFDYRRLA